MLIRVIMTKGTEAGVGVAQSRNKFQIKKTNFLDDEWCSVGVVSGLCVGKSWRMTLLAAVPLCYVMAT